MVLIVRIGRMGPRWVDLGPRWVDFAFFRSARTAWNAFSGFSGCGRVRNAFPDEISVQTVAKQARWSRLKPVSQKETICSPGSYDIGRYRISGSILDSCTDSLSRRINTSTAEIKRSHIYEEESGRGSNGHSRRREDL